MDQDNEESHDPDGDKIGLLQYRMDGNQRQQQKPQYLIIEPNIKY